MNTLSKIWSILEKHRWSFIVPVFAVVLWIYAGIACTPQAESPIRKGVMLNSVELQREWDTWVSQNEIIAKQFEYAGEDIKTQQENWSKVTELLLQVASGSVTSWGGLAQMLMSGGLIGFFADNIRKNGVIGGLKRNRV